jgi:predicted nucleotidyltransferase
LKIPIKPLENAFIKHGVKLAYLFGSQQEMGRALLSGQDLDGHEGSDVDLGVVFEVLPADVYDLYGSLWADLSGMLDPLTVDLVFLAETGYLLQYEAICGECIFCDDEGFRDAYEERVMKVASDLAFKRREFQKDMLQGIKDGYFEIASR